MLGHCHTGCISCQVNQLMVDSTSRSSHSSPFDDIDRPVGGSCYHLSQTFQPLSLTHLVKRATLFMNRKFHLKTKICLKFMWVTIKYQHWLQFQWIIEQISLWDKL